MGTRGMESTVYLTPNAIDETEEGRDEAERATRDPFAGERSGFTTRFDGFTELLWRR